ncbi:tyrosyl or methionyl-tRNA synthetase-like protein [Leishmania tarentolae]|uniref:Tyrosyl or methionyl-tRNA synthetase-like protein n=1 Tax=Leishmania tarentolae TaxID=5689 RepID=A0A640KDH2_LEITA|nr:tyrosyl or methionyl-tRNA synthetase-like protein [Leishmania tarentolae]
MTSSKFLASFFFRTGSYGMSCPSNTTRSPTMAPSGMSRRTTLRSPCPADAGSCGSSPVEAHSTMPADGMPPILRGSRFAITSTRRFTKSSSFTNSCSPLRIVRGSLLLSMFNSAPRSIFSMYSFSLSGWRDTSSTLPMAKQQRDMAVAFSVPAGAAPFFVFPFETGAETVAGATGLGASSAIHDSTYGTERRSRRPSACEAIVCWRVCERHWKGLG